MWNIMSMNRFCDHADRFKEYQLYCERMALSKTSCHPPPPKEYPFLKHRAKKKMMERGTSHLSIYNIYFHNRKTSSN